MPTTLLSLARSAATSRNLCIRGRAPRFRGRLRRGSVRAGLRGHLTTACTRTAVPLRFIDANDADRWARCCLVISTVSSGVSSDHPFAGRAAGTAALPPPGADNAGLHRRRTALNRGNSLTVIQRLLVPTRHLPPAYSFPDQRVTRLRAIAPDRNRPAHGLPAFASCPSPPSWPRCPGCRWMQSGAMTSAADDANPAGMTQRSRAHG